MANPKQTAPFGSWKSPIGPEQVASASANIAEPCFDGENIYWIESRPGEKGRNTVMLLAADGSRKDILPAPLNARSRVNEYGGGSFCVVENIVCFVQFDDQRIYRIDPTAAKAAPEPLTPGSEGNIRYGGLVADPSRRQVLAICEDHRAEGEAATYLVAISIDVDDEIAPPRVLARGHDFYASAAVSPDSKQIAWLAWDHPNMPWDGCECFVGDWREDGELQNVRKVAGGINESLLQPIWSPDNALYLISDRNNWWNIYRVDGDELVPVHQQEAEFGSPLWVFGESFFGFLDGTTLLASYSEQGRWRLKEIDTATGKSKAIESDAWDISYVRAENGRALFVAAGAANFPTLYRYQGGRIEDLARSSDSAIDPEDIAEAEPITFTTASGEQAHAFFYPPRNHEFCGPAHQKPPLLVLCHGGPTGSAHASLSMKIQFWTSRGFAVADVNYAGSVGYGRHYRERLTGQWGVADIADVAACVSYLAEAGFVDGERVAIKGGSAGGYTVLAALAFTDVFKAGASYYGIGDLETLVRDTHKFESRYLDKLVGPYPAEKAMYQARSPIHHVEQLQCPVIFLQGMQDKVVPPNQAEDMVAVLEKKGIPVAYVSFEDEGHGFRQGQNIRRALEAELYFYSQVFGFPPAEPLSPISIRNLPSNKDPGERS